MADLTLVESMQAAGLTGESWTAWRAVAKCADGHGDRMTSAERAIYEQCTQRTRPPTERPSELYIVKGRRCGGTIMGGRVWAVNAATRRYAQLAAGERAIIGLASADREQARGLYGFATEPFTTSVGRAWQSLKDMVSRRTRWALDLSHGVTIEIRTASFGSIRGRTYALVIADELAFWQRDDGSNPASEVLHAIRPGLATLTGQLIGISSPFAKSGPLWDIYTRYYGKDDPRVLVWQAPTRTMNPLIPEALVQDALERDPEAATSEWLAQFRDDAAALVTDAALRKVIRQEEPREVPAYEGQAVVFVDVASGSGQDSFTAGVAVKTRDATGRVVSYVLDVGESRPPFDPAAEVAHLADACKSLGVTRVFGDKFAQGWTDALFRQSGLTYEPSPLSKSELYLAMLSLINSGQVSLPNEARLIAQLMGLVRRPTGSGRESVDHQNRSGSHDDVANAASGAAVLVAGGPAAREFKIW